MQLAGKQRHLRGRSFLAFVVLSASLCACLPERPQSVLPAATVRSLMVGVTIPASKVVFGVADEAPKNDAGWRTVHASAVALADAGSRLKVGARGSAKEDWIRLSQAMAAGAELAASAALHKDADAVASASNEIYEACEACHRKFMEKDARTQHVAGS